MRRKRAHNDDEKQCAVQAEKDSVQHEVALRSVMESRYSSDGAIPRRRKTHDFIGYLRFETSPPNLNRHSCAMRVYSLTPADIPALRALNEVFSRAFEAPEHYADHPPSDAYLARLLARDTFIALVAEEGGAVIGGLVAYELHKFEQARSEVYIYDLAVESRHRRRGIASALITHLQTVAAARDASVIYVQADNSDDPAIALYTKLGTREDVMHFDIAVRGGKSHG
jgi:aminoglycoside 3-N-acetyltransferase I